jgi:hypothetical protein
MIDLDPSIVWGYLLTFWFSGFDLQFLERRDEMQNFYDASQLEATCDAWDSYVSESGLVQDDSGV